MQVRDLIEQLQRIDPHEEVRIELGDKPEYGLMQRYSGRLDEVKMKTSGARARCYLICLLSDSVSTPIVRW